MRLGAVGDVVRTLPAAARLRAGYPHAHIAWLVEPPAASLLAACAWLDEVVVFPRAELVADLEALRLAAGLARAAGFFRALRARGFDLVVDFHSILRSGLLSRATGAARRVALAPPFGRELGYVFANHRVRLRPEPISRFERNTALIDYLALGDERAAPLALDPQRVAKLAAWVGDGPAPAALHLGSSPHTAHKRYPEAGWVSVARGLHQRLGLSSLILWGPNRGERELAERVVAGVGACARLAPESSSLEDLAALQSLCRVFVGPDSGPLHLASLVGVPVVQILGPTDPIHNQPWPETPSRSVRHAVGCSPCRRGCAAATCMRAVPPRAVVDAAAGVLDPGGTG